MTTGRINQVAILFAPAPRGGRAAANSGSPGDGLAFFFSFATGSPHGGCLVSRETRGTRDPPSGGGRLPERSPRKRGTRPAHQIAPTERPSGPVRRRVGLRRSPSLHCKMASADRPGRHADPQVGAIPFRRVTGASPGYRLGLIPH